MLTVEVIGLCAAASGLLLREHSLREKWSWATVVFLVAPAVLVFSVGSEFLINIMRLALAITVARASDVERRARAAIGGGVVALSWLGSTPSELGAWPLVAAAALLTLGLPRRRPVRGAPRTSSHRSDRAG